MSNSAPDSCVLFLGQTGVRKKLVLEALKDEIRRTSESAGVDPQGRWQAFDFEDEFLAHGRSLSSFLQATPQQREERWHRAMSELYKKFAASPARHRGVALHGNYWSQGELFNHVLLDDIKKLNPTCIVTFIDDVFDVHSRILAGDSVIRSGASGVTLPQLVTWRSVEIGLGDLLSRNLVRGRRLPHFVFAVKHSAMTLRQLLLDRQRLPIYASFPITKVRRPRPGINPAQQGSLKREINKFRLDMCHAGYTVLDPLTIDEYRVEPTTGEIYPRWNIDAMKPMVPPIPTRNLHPTTREQMRQPQTWQAMSNDIDKQVRGRDFRMIDAAAVVACYRPKAYDGDHSGGTHEELRYAIGTGRDALVCHDPNRDQGPYLSAGGPFSQEVSPLEYQTLRELLTHLESLQTDRSVPFIANEEPREWTSAANSVLALPY